MLDLDLDFSRYRWAYLYCGVSAIGSLVFGYDNTYYSGILGMQVFANHYGTEIDSSTGRPALSASFQSLTTASIYIGDVLGALISGPLNDKFGRRAVLWLASLFVLAGGVCQVVDTHYEGIIVLGRILIGLGVGNFTVTSLLYMGEVAPVKVRGPALMMYQFLQSCSQLVAAGLTQGTNSIQSTLSYKLPMGGLIVLPLVLMVWLPFVPESPTWLVYKDEQGKAAASLRKIHRSNPDLDVETEISNLETTRQYEAAQRQESSWVTLVTNDVERRKAIWAACGLGAQQICGITFFYNYGVVFAEEIGVSQPFTINLITMILQIFAVGAAVLTGNKVRRRTNLLVSISLILMAYLVVGGIGAQKSLNTPSKYLIVIFSYVVIVAFNYGLGPLTYQISRELAVGPNQNKIMSLSVFSLYFCLWLISFTAPYLYTSAGLGPKVSFVYVAGTLASLAWAYFGAPETKGRTSLDIEELFQKGIPARHWREYVLPEVTSEGKEKHQFLEGSQHVETVSENARRPKLSPQWAS